MSFSFAFLWTFQSLFNRQIVAFSSLFSHPYRRRYLRGYLESIYEQQIILNSFPIFEVYFDYFQGKMQWLWDHSGKKYLDMFGGNIYHNARGPQVCLHKEDVGLAYVLEKYDIRGVLDMIMWFICVYWTHINFQRSSFSIRLTLAAVQSLKIVPTSKIHIKPCINLST